MSQVVPVDVCVSETLAAGAPEIWRLVGNFADLSAWSPEARLLQIEGSGHGAVRTLATPGGRFVERCDILDETTFTLCYSVVDAPWSLSRYAAKVRVLPVEPAACRIEWSGCFEVDARHAARAHAGVARMYQRFISQLKTHLGT